MPHLPDEDLHQNGQIKNRGDEWFGTFYFFSQTLKFSMWFVGRHGKKLPAM